MTEATPATALRHDPRVDEPTPADRRRVWKWLALLALSPLCAGVVVWATFGLNGAYPTVKPPVPAGWQAISGIYASFSVPKSWTLQEALSDSVGDVYYSGHGGGAGESVIAAGKTPSPNAPTHQIVGVFLQEHYTVLSISPYKLTRATVAWRYRFKLQDGTSAAALLAWARSSDSEVWLVVSPRDATTEKVLSTLTLAL